MKESLIVISLPASEISYDVQNKIADLISRDTGCERRDIVLHQIPPKEIVLNIASLAKVMHHVKVEEDPEQEVSTTVTDALGYILTKYEKSGKLQDINTFRVHFIVDAQNAFSAKRNKDTAKFKECLSTIATNMGICARAIRTLFPNSGFTRDHLDAIFSVHNYYTKSYV